MLCFRVLGLMTLGILVHLGYPGTLLAGDSATGRALYQQYCSTCHGAQGKGDGPAASALNPKPRDHTDGRYMNALSDAHLQQVISAGGAAVQRSPLMPAWQGILTPQQIDDVIAYLRTLAVPPYKP
jgi:mono/diheme cytochrome c family protein